MLHLVLRNLRLELKTILCHIPGYFPTLICTRISPKLRMFQTRNPPTRPILAPDQLENNGSDIAEEAAQCIPTLYTQLHSENPKKSKSSCELTGGCDCWALVLGTNHSSEPDQATKQAARLLATAHLKVVPSALRRPSSGEFSRLLCVLCL
ncbi:hypothetical protein RSAG8_13855, partial [Rhizoctonia solani AG-8 WAC10335]